MEASKLRELEEMCRKHDWTYDWSEDSSTWDKGAAERAELDKFFDAFQGMDRLEALRIWNTHAPDVMQRPFPKSIYLSGKITGLSLIEASKKFSEAERILVDVAKVINPYEIGLPDEHQWISEGISEKERWERHMDRDLDLLRNCDCIYMLDNWKESTGAIIEIKEAISHNIQVVGHVTNDDIAELRKIMLFEALHR
jgi:hypothetical protein